MGRSSTQVRASDHPPTTAHATLESAGVDRSARPPVLVTAYRDPGAQAFADGQGNATYVASRPGPNWSFRPTAAG